MQKYQGEPIPAQIVARMVPPDSSYPDCRCGLVVTPDRLFVLEDNFDGTVTEHFAVPLEQVAGIEFAAFPTDEKNRDAPPADAQPSPVRETLLALAGVVSTPRRAPQKQLEYLRVRFSADIGQGGSLYFSEYPRGSATKRFIRAFARAKARAAADR